MKKWAIFLVRFSFSSILISGCFESVLAEKEESILQEDTLLSDAIKRLSSHELIKENFIITERFAKPDPVKPEKVMGEFLLGACGALGFGFAGARLFNKNFKDADDFVGYSGLSGAALGYLIGSNLGCALGVYLIGNLGEDEGSLGHACEGSVSGTVVGGGLVYLLFKMSNEENDLLPLYGVMLTASQAAGATISFNHFRKKKVEASSGALLNLNKGKLSLAFPQVDLSKEFFSSNSYEVNLFQASF